MIVRAFLPALLLLSACSGSGDSTDVRGTWQVKGTAQTEEDTDKVRIDFTFDQDGDEVFGSFAGADGSGGTVEGEVFDRTLDVIATQLAPCAGLFRLLATLADEDRDGDFRELTGTYIGEDCEGDFSAAVTGTRKRDQDNDD